MYSGLKSYILLCLELYLCFSCDGSNSVSTVVRNDVGVGTSLNGSTYFFILSIGSKKITVIKSFSI